MISFGDVVTLLFQQDYFKNGKEEIDDHKRDGKFPGILLVNHYVQEEENEAGKQFDDAGKHIARHKTLSIFALVIAQHYENSKQGDDKEEEDNEGRAGEA